MLCAGLAGSEKRSSRIGLSVLLAVAAAFLSLSVAAFAQEQGPLQPAAPQDDDYPSQPAPAPRRAAASSAASPAGVSAAIAVQACLKRRPDERPAVNSRGPDHSKVRRARG